MGAGEHEGGGGDAGRQTRPSRDWCEAMGTGEVRAVCNEDGVGGHRQE